MTIAVGIFVTVRLFSVLLVQTWFVADEFWQATEIAHHMAFGYGYRTWEWKEGIRGAFYPTVIAGIYKLLAIVKLDHPFFLIHIPRILHALLFALGDYQAWNLCRQLYGRPSASWSIVFIATSWFLEYCAPRTLTSCIEMILLLAAFSHYPWKRQNTSNNSASYLWLVGLACCVRPTAAVPFIPLFLQHLYRAPSKIRFIISTIVVLGLTVGLSVYVDSWYYGRWVFVPWKFAEFNVISGLASHYGTQPWHWYITQGLPATLFTHLIPFVLAIHKHKTRHKGLLTVIGFTVVVYSFLGHKEFRFLLPILPLCMIIAADYIAFQLAARHKRLGHSSTVRWGLVALLVLPNFLMFLYFGLVHQRAPLDALTELYEDLPPPPARTQILFLTPCHSTPYYSQLHRKIPMRFLTCEPNLKHIENYMDEAEIFEMDPMAWLHNEYGEDLENIPQYYKPIPGYIVLYDVMRPKIKEFLARNKFRLCHDLFNSHFDDGRRSKRLLIFCR